jgi:putative FmdB family regulatory protein
MPTYDYECNACGHAFEEFQSIKAEPIHKCPKCGKKKVRRLIGIGAGVIFKGSGFYQTDYRSESYKAGAAKDKAAAGGGASAADKGGGEKGGTGGSDKKPATEGTAAKPAGGGGEGGGKSKSDSSKKEDSKKED